MAPKRNAKDAAPASTAAIATTPTPNPRASSRSTSGAHQWDKVIVNIYDHYQTSTPQRTKLIDIFMAFLVAAGGVQFLYCVLAGNFVCRSHHIPHGLSEELQRPRHLRHTNGANWIPFVHSLSTHSSLASARLLVSLFWRVRRDTKGDVCLDGLSLTNGTTASLRIQTTEANKSDFPSVSPERYVVQEVILAGITAYSDTQGLRRLHRL